VLEHGASYDGDSFAIYLLRLLSLLFWYPLLFVFFFLCVCVCERERGCDGILDVEFWVPGEALVFSSYCWRSQNSAGNTGQIRSNNPQQVRDGIEWDPGGAVWSICYVDG
jgi:hypothetical protein